MLRTGAPHRGMRGLPLAILGIFWGCIHPGSSGRIVVRAANEGVGYCRVPSKLRQRGPDGVVRALMDPKARPQVKVFWRHCFTFMSVAQNQR
jgi:hypothetical protein